MKRHYPVDHKGCLYNQIGGLINIVISEGLGKRFCDLRRSPIVLLIFPDIILDGCQTLIERQV